MFQRQVFTDTARNTEEANRRHMSGLSAYGAIWDPETGKQLAWVEKGDVSVNGRKVAIERDFELFALDGTPLGIHLDIVNGGCRLVDAAGAGALARFKKIVGG